VTDRLAQGRLRARRKREPQITPIGTDNTDEKGERMEEKRGSKGHEKENGKIGSQAPKRAKNRAENK
jgi:hypothetical protein